MHNENVDHAAHARGPTTCARDDPATFNQGSHDTLICYYLKSQEFRSKTWIVRKKQINLSIVMKVSNFTLKNPPQFT